MLATWMMEAECCPEVINVIRLSLHAQDLYSPGIYQHMLDICDAMRCLINLIDKEILFNILLKHILLTLHLPLGCHPCKLSIQNNLAYLSD